MMAMTKTFNLKVHVKNICLLNINRVVKLSVIKLFLNNHIVMVLIIIKINFHVKINAVFNLNVNKKTGFS